jgi:N-acetylglucosamine transport system permease protein
MTTHTEQVPAQAVTTGTTTGRPARRQRHEGGVLNVLSHGFLVLWAAMVIFPLVWAVLTAFKDNHEIFNHPWGLPGALRWSNFADAWTKAHIGTYFINTIIVMAGGVVGTMLFGSMAAYILARFPFPGNRFVYYLFIGGMSFPVFMALVPLFFVLKGLGTAPAIGPFLGLGSRGGLMLVYIAYSLPFTVFFLVGFFRTLPSSVAEAATIDGASQTTTFFRIMLPMAKPGIISIGIFNVLGQWNQFLLPQVLNQGTNPHFVLTQGLQDLNQQTGYAGNWGEMFAGLTIAMLPMILFYVIFQRQVQAGLTAGALK